MIVAHSSVSCFPCLRLVIVFTSVRAEGGRARQGGLHRRKGVKGPPRVKGWGGSPPVGAESAAAARVGEGRGNCPPRRVACPT